MDEEKKLLGQSAENDQDEKEENNDNEDDKKKYATSVDGFSLVPPKQTCFVLSFSFLMVIASFQGLQNLQSSLNKEKSVGVMSLVVTYGSQTFSSLLSPFWVRIFGVKNTVILCWCTVTLYTISNFHPTYIVIVTSSILLGAGLGSLPVVQGLYLTAASKSYLYYEQLPENRLYGVLSICNGFLYAFFTIAHMSGNYLVSALFFKSEYNNTHLDSNVCGARFCEHAAQNETVIERPEARVVYTLLGVFTLCGVAGIVIVALFLPRLDQYAGHKGSVMESVFISLKVMRSWRFCCIGILNIAQPFSLMIVYTVYTKNFVSCSIGIKWVGYTMMSFGVTGTVTALAGNAVGHYVGRATLVITFIFVDVGNAIFMLMWTPRSDSDTVTFFLVPALSGISGSLALPQVMAIATLMFKNSEAAAFSSVTFLRSATFVISLSVSGWICLYYSLVSILVINALALVGYIVLEVNILCLRKNKGF